SLLDGSVRIYRCAQSNPSAARSTTGFLPVDQCGLCVAQSTDGFIESKVTGRAGWSQTTDFLSTFLFHGKRTPNTRHRTRYFVLVSQSQSARSFFLGRAAISRGRTRHLCRSQPASGVAERDTAKCRTGEPPDHAPAVASQR